jgi:tetratricopeptide (TPR) repeat protein/CHAT domain-containing protein
MRRIILVMLAVAAFALTSLAHAQQSGPVTKQPGMLGIQMHTLSKAEAEKVGLDRPAGVWVDSVNEGGPAQTAGIKPGDVIISADGVAIESYDHFRAVVGTKGAGTEVTFQLLNEGKSSILKATLAPRSQALASADQMKELYQSFSGLYRQGKYGEAEAVAERLLNLVEKQHGPEDPWVAAALDNLSLVQNLQGKHEEAAKGGLRALAIKEKSLGADHADVAMTLNGLANIYSNQGRYREAIETYTRALAIREKVLGPNEPRVAATLNNLAVTYKRQGRYDEAIKAYTRSMEIYEKIFGQDHPDLATGLNNLGNVHKDQGRYEEAVKFLKRALAIREKALGPSHPEVAATLNNLGLVYDRLGRYEEAIDAYTRALAIDEKALGPEHPDVAGDLDNRALVYAAVGRYEEAIKGHAQALSIREKVLGPYHRDVAATLNNLAIAHETLGKYDEALKGHTRALAIREKVLGPDHPELAATLNNLGIVYNDQERYDEAIKVFTRSIAIREKVLGPEHADLATTLSNLGNVYQDQRRYEEALARYEQALSIQEKTLGSNHPEAAGTLSNIANVYTKQSKLEEAIEAYTRSLAIKREALGPEHPGVALDLNNLANANEAQGRHDEAIEGYAQALSIRQKALGSDHPLVASALGNLAGVYIAQQRWAAAQEHWRRAASIAERRLRLAAQPSARKPTSEAARSRKYFEGAVKTAYRISVSGSGPSPDTVGELFLKTQWAVRSEASMALAEMAARGAKGNPGLAALVRERQDLFAEWQRRDEARTNAVSQPPDKRNKGAETANEARLQAIEKRVGAVDKQLDVDFPDYAALASPSPLSVEEVQNDLASDEALVLFLDTAAFKPLPEETFVWVITKTDVRWVRSDLGTKALQERVAALRCGLDRAGEWVWSDEKYRWLAGNPACEALRPEGLAIREPLPFNPVIAHELYEKLFGDVRKLIKGKHLLIVASGALTSLPFQVLVTKPPVPGQDYRSLAWLARDHALTVLPSAASLKALRRNAKVSSAAKPFIGFGNPVLAGLCGPVSIPKACPDEDNEQTEALTVAARSAGILGAAPEYFRDGLADVVALRKACPLPDTAHELKCVARSLGAPPSSLVLGKDMTEAAVKKTPLDRYRIVHFATHGLLAGETERFTKTRAEPALLFTPPDNATDEDDGLLTASEIAGLKLDADWVVMSACNTAAGNNPGAEALSGLAKAFFYAGARALLVSHWPVNTNAATLLTSRTFAELRSSKSIGRAEAFRRAMLALIDDKQRPWAAHPSVWAPFVVVGEGGGAR